MNLDLQKVLPAEAFETEQNEGDYIGKDGLLYCGVCRTKKQTRLPASDFTGGREIIVPCICKCKVEENKRKEEEEKKRQEMQRLERLKTSSLMDAKLKAAEAKKAQEAAAEVEQTEPQSEMGKVIESIEKSAFAQAVAGETQAAPAAQVVDPFAPKEEPEQEKKYRVRFFADGTKEQLGKLIAFMNENNIKYGKIAKESK